MKKTILFFSALLVISLGAQAQFATATLDIANFRAPIRSDGQLFQDASSNLPGLEWPKTGIAADRRYISYTGQIWMAGRDQNDTLRVAANEYGQVAKGYYPGRAGFNPNTYDAVWKITKASIDQFRADFINGTVNFANYPQIQTWPAFGTDLQGNVKNYAPFVDVDGDPNTYNPAAGDYPDIPGDQAIFFGFTDDPYTFTPQFIDYLGFDVLGFAYAYDCPQLENIMFLQYDVINPGLRTLNDFRLGMWLDGDVGNYADDYIGSDTTGTLPMIYTFNGDANDESAQGYGLNPPACGLTLLSEPADAGMFYQNDFSVVGNPNTAADYAGYLNATWKDSTALTFGGSGHLSGGAPTRFPFTGNNGYCGGPSSGWTENTAGNTPFDRRTILASDAQVFAPATTKRYTFAVLMARGYYNDNNGSVCELLALQDSLTQWVGSGDMPCADISSRITPPAATLQAALIPNPTHQATVLRFQNPLHETATIQLLDLQGRTIAPLQSTQETQCTLATDGLSSGLYLVQLRLGNQHTVLRLQKN